MKPFIFLLRADEHYRRRRRYCSDHVHGPADRLPLHQGMPTPFSFVFAGRFDLRTKVG